jgi:hypothetical protein
MKLLGHIKDFLIKPTYHGFNIVDSAMFAPEGSTWLYFLAFCKFLLPLLYASTKNVMNIVH